MNAKTRSTLLIVIGIISIILGIVCFYLSSGYWESNEYYGGDAYTGIQQAAAQTANNIIALATIAKVGFGSVLTVSGLSMIVFAIPVKEAAESTKENEAADEIPDL